MLDVQGGGRTRCEIPIATCDHLLTLVGGWKPIARRRDDFM